MKQSLTREVPSIIAREKKKDMGVRPTRAVAQIALANGKVEDGRSGFR